MPNKVIFFDEDEAPIDEEHLVGLFKEFNASPGEVKLFENDEQKQDDNLPFGIG